MLFHLAKLTPESKRSLLYALTAPLYPFLQKRFGGFVTSTDVLGASMFELAAVGRATLLR